MPADGSFVSAETLDVTAAHMRPYFAQGTSGSGSSFLSGARWTCDRLSLKAGLEPSIALCRIPMAALTDDENAPAVAAVRTSPLQGIKIGTPCEIRGHLGGNIVTLMAGRVTEIHPALGTDQASVVVQDERWILAGCFLAGSFWASDSGSPAATAYRNGELFAPNKDGRANARWVGELGEFYPMMCPKDYGLANGEAPPASADVVNGVNKAVFWTPWMILRYLRMAFDSAVFATYVKTKFPWYAAVPSSISWPTGADSALEQELGTNTTAKSAMGIFEGMNLWETLVRACEMCGPFTPYLGGEITINADKSVDFKNQIAFMRKRYNGVGITVSRPSSGNAADTLKQAKTLTDGYLSERGNNLYTRIASAGEIVYIQRRIDSDTGASLEAAWTAADQTTAQNLYRTRRNAGDDKATAKAKVWRNHPNVFSAFRIVPSFDYYAGTSESSFPRAVVPRIPLPELLTSYLEGTATTLQEKSQFKRPVLLEHKKAGVWTLADWNDGFRIEREFGYMTFDGMRERGETFDITGSDTIGGNTAVFTARPLRLTVAIPCDHRLLASYKLASDPTENVASIPPDPNSDDADRLDPSLSRLLYADTPGLCALEIIKTSYTIPEAAGGTQDTDNNVHRDDSAQATNHALNRLNEVGRIERGGALVEKWLRFAWRPGISIRSLGNTSGSDFPIKCVVQEVNFSGVENTVEIILA